jgi:hypothetical protein
MKTKTIAFILFTVGCGVAIMAVAGPPVLPPLNPPAPPYETCKPVGSGAICRGEVGDTFDQEPTGIVCGTAQMPVELLQSGTQSARAVRYYDRDGNLTRRTINEDIEGTIINPVTGLSAKLTIVTDLVDTFAVPGDFNSVTEKQTGPLKISLPGSGVLFLDTGPVIFDPQGDIVKQSGHNHDFIDYFTGHPEAAAVLCTALGSPGTP